MIQLGYDVKIRLKRYSHLAIRYYRTRAFLQLFATARVRNSTLFTWLSFIGAALSYGRNSRAVAMRPSIFFGHSGSTRSFFRKIEAFSEPKWYQQQVHKSLSSELFNIHFTDGTQIECIVHFLVFDNTQRNFRLKFQRGGRTSIFIKLTSRAFLKVWVGSWGTIAIPIPKYISSTITYVDQAVVSPMGMPPYELLRDMGDAEVKTILLSPHHTCMSMFETTTPPPIVDISGERVQVYMQLLKIADNLMCLYRYISPDPGYTFQPEEILLSPKCRRIVGILGRMRQKGSVMAKARIFQRSSVLHYKGQRPKALLLCLPVLKADETTNKGMMTVMTNLLIDAELMCANHGFPENKCPQYVCTDDCHRIYVPVVGDGLTQERWMVNQHDLLNSYRFNSNNPGHGYKEHYAQAQEYLKALSRTILVPGDLHAALFHTLGPIYTLDYGGFLQVF